MRPCFESCSCAKGIVLIIRTTVNNNNRASSHPCTRKWRMMGAVAQEAKAEVTGDTLKVSHQFRAAVKE